MDAPRIRAHLVESSERKRDEDLVAAGQAPTSTERERLREDAEKSNLARKARIDDLVDSFITIDAKTGTGSVFREMTRILSEEGVDAALAYVDKRRAGVLDRIQSRIASEHEQNRIDLQPLLKAAGLRSAKGENDAARSSYQHLLSLEPGWPDALEAFGWFLIDQSVQSRRHGTIRAAFADSQEALAQTQLLLGQDESNPRSQRIFSAALDANADILSVRRQPGDADQVLKYYEHSLEIGEGLLKSNPGSDQAAHDLTLTLVGLADFLSSRGQPGDADQALIYYTRGLNISEGMLKATPGSSQAAHNVAVTLTELGDLLSRRGQAADADQALKYYSRSLEICEGLLKANPGSGEAARDVSIALGKLGDFLSVRGNAGDADQALSYYTRDLDICEGLLKHNPRSNLAARDVFVALDKLADLLNALARPGDADQALIYYTRGLKICEGLLQSNTDSGEAARDVSVALDKLGISLSARGNVGDADQALIYYTRSLNISEGLLKATPGSSQAARDVAAILNELGDLLSGRGQAADTDLALKYYSRSLEICDGLLKNNPGSDEATSDDYATLMKLSKFFAGRGQADECTSYLLRAMHVLKNVNPDEAGAAHP